jgi:hypothetical protein
MSADGRLRPTAAHRPNNSFGTIQGSTVYWTDWLLTQRAEPLHHHDVDLVDVLQDEVHQIPSLAGAELRAAQCSVGVVIVVWEPVPWRDLEDPADERRTQLKDLPTQPFRGTDARLPAQRTADDRMWTPWWPELGVRPRRRRQ